MAAIEAAMKSLLHSVSALVAVIPATQICPEVLPESSVLNGVTFSMISCSPVQTASGPSGLVESRWQIDIFHTAKSSLVTARQAVQSALDGYHGTQSSVTIEVIQMINQFTGIDRVPGHEAVDRYRVTQEYIVWYKES